MTTFDARALLNDFEYCVKHTPFAITLKTILDLCDMAQEDDVEPTIAAQAAHICEWLIANPACYQLHKEHVHPDYTGSYFAALIEGSQYLPKASDEHIDYRGYTVFPAEEVAGLYSHGDNMGCMIGQYALVEGDDGICDARRWSGSEWMKLRCRPFVSELLGAVEPRDYYQRCAFDSLQQNDITVLYGNSGTGKTLLPLAYLMQELQSGRITRCHMIYHYEKLKYSRELGYVKGTLQDKLMQTGAIGNILASKMGSRDEVLHLINDGVINIMPTNAIRGFEAGDSEAIYCTEAQDLDAYTTRTIIQRARKGCKVIFEGDVAEQKDIPRRSGLGQLIDVFKGTAGFGCIELKNDYRSPYGRLADRIR